MFVFILQIWVPDVARILVGLNNKNPQSNIGVNAEAEKQDGQPLKSSFNSANAQSSDCNSGLRLSPPNLRL